MSDQTSTYQTYQVVIDGNVVVLPFMAADAMQACAYARKVMQFSNPIADQDVMNFLQVAQNGTWAQVAS